MRTMFKAALYSVSHAVDFITPNLIKVPWLIEGDPSRELH